MVHTRMLKIKLEGYGNYLGCGRGNFTLKTKDGHIKNYPYYEKIVKEA